MLLYHLNLLQPVPVTDRDVSRVTYDDSAMQILRSIALVRYYCSCMGPSTEYSARLQELSLAYIYICQAASRQNHDGIKATQRHFDVIHSDSFMSMTDWLNCSYSRLQL